MGQVGMIEKHSIHVDVMEIGSREVSAGKRKFGQVESPERGPPQIGATQAKKREFLTIHRDVPEVAGMSEIHRRKGPAGQVRSRAGRAAGSGGGRRGRRRGGNDTEQGGRGNDADQEEYFKENRGEVFLALHPRR